MSQNAKPDRIVIRYWPDEISNPIAIFVDQPETQPGTYNSYQRAGQHGSCSRDVIAVTKPLFEHHRYAQALIKELRAIGYNPVVRSRWPASR